MPRELKVGLFVILGLALAMVAIFLIGDTRRLWESKTSYRAAFKDVAGLKPGAPVRMGGLDIGSVTSVGHDGDPERRAHLRRDVDRQAGGRAHPDRQRRARRQQGPPRRQDGRADGRLAGLAADAAPVRSSHRKSRRTSSPSPTGSRPPQSVRSSGSSRSRRQLGDPKFAEDIRGSAADVHSLLDAIVHGDGTMHRLFFDRAEADQIDEALANLNRTSAQLERDAGGRSRRHEPPAGRARASRTRSSTTARSRRTPRAPSHELARGPARDSRGQRPGARAPLRRRLHRST